MPTSGQAFSIHDLDQFQLRFNVTDNVAALDVSDAKGWWGVADDVDDHNPIPMQKSNAAWDQNITNYGGMDINANSIDCFSVLNNNGNYDGTINLQPASWGSDTSVSYYHELIYSATGEVLNSTVIATGTLTVYRSAFTELDFRK